MYSWDLPPTIADCVYPFVSLVDNKWETVCFQNGNMVRAMGEVVSEACLDDEGGTCVYKGNLEIPIEVMLVDMLLYFFCFLGIYIAGRWFWDGTRDLLQTCRWRMEEEENLSPLTRAPKPGVADKVGKCLGEVGKIVLNHLDPPSYSPTSEPLLDPQEDCPGIP